ncbi:hypothetical protein [Hydrocarboniphaga effusa]|uniref:hypothetical protein n=1 Tax=Hydrocarboniphaga effusa TaxID=243629 RepID=UPI0035B15F75
MKQQKGRFDERPGSLQRSDFAGATGFCVDTRQVHSEERKAPFSGADRGSDQTADL